MEKIQPGILSLYIEIESIFTSREFEKPRFYIQYKSL